MDDEGQRVLLIGVPRTALRDAGTYISDVIRELQLIELGLDQGIAAPSRLRELAIDLRPTLVWARDVLTHAAVTPLDSGAVDLRLTVPPRAGDDVVRLVGLVAELQLFAEQGSLFAEPGADVRDLIDWLADQALSQLDGAEPVAYAR